MEYSLAQEGSRGGPKRKEVAAVVRKGHRHQCQQNVQGYKETIQLLQVSVVVSVAFGD